MNAYEVADELQIVEDKAEAHAMVHIKTTVADAQVMLRQQADRIKELDKRYATLLGKNVAYLGVEQKLKDRIAELEKDLSLKTRDRDVYRDFTLAYEERIAELEKAFSDVYKEYKEYCTHPAKTLTDEEIHKLWLECWDEIDFARAILRKAQDERK
jgi:hypothetical protein